VVPGLAGERTLEATPIAVDAWLFFPSTYGKTYAVEHAEVDAVAV